MILLEVEDYCQQCLDFTPDVVKPDRHHTEDGELVLGDTIVRCEYRKRCAGIRRFLEKQMREEVSG